ncbi:hypothetical protein ACFE04_021791 [Oxalis oulophora]
MRYGDCEENMDGYSVGLSPPHSTFYSASLSLSPSISCSSLGTLGRFLSPGASLTRPLTRHTRPALKITRPHSLARQPPHSTPTDLSVEVTHSETLTLQSLSLTSQSHAPSRHSTPSIHSASFFNSLDNPPFA